MKRKFSILLVSTVIIGAILSLVGIALVSQAKSEPMARKIVIFKSGVLNEPAREALMKKFGGVKVKDLTLIDGKTMLLSPKAEAALARQAGVLRIDDDVVVEALFREGSVKVNKASPQPTEKLPWGVDRIDAELVWGGVEDAINVLPGYNAGAGIKVGIIDTGISNTHPDLFANVKGGVNTINPFKNWNDDNGHGSHVAGIVAGLDNNIGVIGVGPAIDLYAIKVLGASGSGYLSDVIEGIQWAITNNMQVVNISLGTTSDIQSFHDAVSAAKTTGIVVVAAAGNSGGSVIFPAAYPETIAVSATDQNNVIASWSSRGPEVDLAAPGVSIYSTYKGTGYATLSGTSMAAPHVTGAAALVIASKTCGNCSPDEVQTKLQATATNLGDAGFDTLYGWGLVNAYAATQ